MPEEGLRCNTTVNLTWKKTRLTVFYYLCAQGSYWAIDTNPKEDALPTRPKKRPRSGERVSIWRTPHLIFFWRYLVCHWFANHPCISPVCLLTLLYLPHIEAWDCTSRLYVTTSPCCLSWSGVLINKLCPGQPLHTSHSTLCYFFPPLPSINAGLC